MKNFKNNLFLVEYGVDFTPQSLIRDGNQGTMSSFSFLRLFFSAASGYDILLFSSTARLLTYNHESQPRKNPELR